MKTAVSIPDDVFEGAERLAKRAKKSRSQLYSDALREYVARHSPDEVTDAMNRVCEELRKTDSLAVDPFLTEAARQIFEKNEW
jgi:metal-responsive CopG/Arc/MetJ family transcriptional regulator